MRSSALLLGLVVPFFVGNLLAADLLPLKGHPDSSDWPALIAEDFSNSSEDRCLWSSRIFDDCIVDLEFKNAEGTNSGVIVYCTDVNNWIPSTLR